MHQLLTYDMNMRKDREIVSSKSSLSGLRTIAVPDNYAVLVMSFVQGLLFIPSSHAYGIIGW